jgi:crotonobetainyl-CoA:carnitine CoA-transferase CaiB-like acyl-CoA transferase
MGALEGIRVFDLTIAANGPWATKLLGGLGADVIKVEDPRGELAHGVPPLIKGTSVLYISANHNKRNITLDLKTERGRNIASELLKGSDVFVENMRPGAVEKLGFGYDVVSQIRPEIVYCSASAYGRTGPMGGEAGADPTVQAFSGVCSITGQAGGRGEFFRHFTHIDFTTSSVIVEAVLQGLLARARTGKGQRIEIEMLTAAVGLQTNKIAEYFATGVTPKRMGSAASNSVPHQAFLCEDQKYLTVGVVREEQWPRFCRAMGLEDLTEDSRFETNHYRIQHRSQLVPMLEERFRTRPARWWTIRLTEQRVPNSYLFDFEALRYHPQVLENRHIVQLDTPHWGRLYADGLPWKFSGTPAGPIHAGGLAGEHTEEVLKELGLTCEK